jgi:hypothetical protein
LTTLPVAASQQVSSRAAVIEQAERALADLQVPDVHVLVAGGDDKAKVAAQRHGRGGDAAPVQHDVLAGLQVPGEEGSRVGDAQPAALLVEAHGPGADLVA